MLTAAIRLESTHSTDQPPRDASVCVATGKPKLLVQLAQARRARHAEPAPRRYGAESRSHRGAQPDGQPVTRVICGSA